MKNYEVTLKTKQGRVILKEVGDSEDVKLWKIIAKTRGYQIEVKETERELVQVNPIQVKRGNMIANPFK